MSTHHDCKHGKAYWQDCEECKTANDSDSPGLTGYVHKDIYCDVCAETEEHHLKCSRCGQISDPTEHQTEQPEASSLSDLLVCMGEMVDIIKLSHKEIGSCDHDVGICLCGEYSVLDNATRLIEKHKAHNARY